MDAPGAVHHIIIRGIERRKMFWDDVDRNDSSGWTGGHPHTKKDQLLCLGFNPKSYSSVPQPYQHERAIFLTEADSGKRIEIEHENVLWSLIRGCLGKTTRQR